MLRKNCQRLEIKLSWSDKAERNRLSGKHFSGFVRIATNHKEFGVSARSKFELVSGRTKWFDKSIGSTRPTLVFLLNFSSKRVSRISIEWRLKTGEERTTRLRFVSNEKRSSMENIEGRDFLGILLDLFLFSLNSNSTSLLDLFLTESSRTISWRTISTRDICIEKWRAEQFLGSICIEIQRSFFCWTKLDEDKLHDRRRRFSFDVTDDRMPNTRHLIDFLVRIVGRLNSTCNVQQIEQTFHERLFHRFDLTRVDVPDAD